ncbi:hypothetical protein NC651_002180 [Populus alba x Populus x berolinensis]|nr:hypothetical protein NC651_002180 [Populus alba x Populus x berolinensis]
MKLHNRKLQVPFNDAPFEHPITPTFQTSNSTMSPPPQRSTGTPGPASTSSRPSRASTSSRITRGLDPQVVNSLPVYSYYHGDVKYQIECAICLGEFKEKEAVKMIPKCHHVFHLQCIDTWLAMHVTCPVCRGAHFVHEKGGGNDGLGVIQERVDQGASQPEGDTSLEVRGELIGVQA